MLKHDVVLTNVTIVQLLRQPCPGKGGGGATPGRVRKGGHGHPDPMPSASMCTAVSTNRGGGHRRLGQLTKASGLFPLSHLHPFSCTLCTAFQRLLSEWWRGRARSRGPQRRLEPGSPVGISEDTAD